MKNKLYTILTILLITMLTTSPVFARGAIKLSEVTFSLGSLIATGFASGLGNTDVTLVLDASGEAHITCINYGGNTVPGQSYPKIDAVGTQSLAGGDPRSKNGRTPFNTETDDPEFVAWDAAGCPNSNWAGHIDAIFWTGGTISVYPGLYIDLNNRPTALLVQPFACDPSLQTETSVSCWLVK